MTLVEYHDQRIVTTVCPLCGGERGVAFGHFARHLAADHTPDDLAGDARAVVIHEPDPDDARDHRGGGGYGP